MKKYEQPFAEIYMLVADEDILIDPENEGTVVDGSTGVEDDTIPDV